MTSPLPCPFCGSPASVNYNFGRDPWVQCKDLKCAATDGKEYETEQDAIAAWNRRATASIEPSADPNRDAVLEEAATACEAWGNAKVAKWADDPDMLADAKARAWDSVQCAHAVRALKIAAPATQEAPAAPKFDEAEFDAMVEKGTKAWAGVPNNWLEVERGNDPDPADGEKFRAHLQWASDEVASWPAWKRDMWPQSAGQTDVKPAETRMDADFEGAGRIAPQGAQAQPVPINDAEMAALRRFHECATDGEGYDVPKEMMQRLAKIGLVRRATANYYEHTDFGLAVLGEWGEAQQDSDEQIIAKFEAAISEDPTAYSRPGECVYQITRNEVIAYTRAITAARASTAGKDSA